MCYFLFIKCDKYVETVKLVQIDKNLQVIAFTVNQIIHN